MGVVGGQRVVGWSADRVGMAVEDGEEEGLEPRGAGLWEGHEEDVGGEGLEVGPARECALELWGGVPEALVLEKVGPVSPSSLFREGEEKSFAFFTPHHLFFFFL